MILRLLGTKKDAVDWEAPGQNMMVVYNSVVILASATDTPERRAKK